MAIKPTSKTGGTPLQAFYQNGWTTAQLIDNGYAVEEAEAPAPAAAKAPTVWRTTAVFGKCGNDSSGQLLPNPFGLTTTAEVRAIWEDVSPVANFKNGYSFEQQVVFAAMEMMK